MVRTRPEQMFPPQRKGTVRDQTGSPGSQALTDGFYINKQNHSYREGRGERGEGWEAGERHTEK